MRSALGTMRNRLSSTIAKLQGISPKLSAARSQIQDAGVARETANMSSVKSLSRPVSRC